MSLKYGKGKSWNELTFLIVLLAIRFILFIVNRKGSQIQKPDWLEGDERFEVKKRKKGR